jgi:hypothetical protein
MSEAVTSMSFIWNDNMPAGKVKPMPMPQLRPTEYAILKLLTIGRQSF